MVGVGWVRREARRAGAAHQRFEGLVGGGIHPTTDPVGLTILALGENASHVGHLTPSLRSEEW